MKIGIFGDSYGEINSESTDTAWVDFLKEKYDVTNYSKSASCLYYSVSKFLENHQNFEKIIFLVTKHGRIYIPNTKKCHSAGLEHSRFLHKNADNYLDKISHKTSIDYYTYLYDEKQDMLFHRLMFNECINLRPDALFIPCFEESNYQKNSQVMIDINLIDISYFNLSKDFLNGKIIDRRQCHMNAENNKIFANIVNEWIVNDNFNLDLNKFVKPIGKNVQDLFLC